MPSRWSITSPKSRAPTGSRASAAAAWRAHSPDHLKLTDDAGEALGTGIERAGGSVALLAQAKRSDIAAAFELHIEQGPFLEAERIDIGVVTAIAGILRLEVLFTGAADHAGTTPFTHRRDASLAAAYTHPGRPRRSRTLRGFGARLFRCHDRHRGRGTERRERRAPHGRIVVDARFVDSTLAARFTAALDEATAQAAATAAARGPPLLHPERFASLALRCRSPRHPFVPADLGSPCAHDVGSRTRHGLSHRIAPAAMVFVPCRDGRSHTPEEWAEPEAIAAGAAVLLEAVIAFDRGAAARDPQRSNSERTT